MNINKILLFGSTGMVGKNIMLSDISKKYTFLHPSRDEVDLEIYNEVYNYIEIHKPDIIINAAGLVGGIIKNSKNNYNFLDKNIAINYNIIKSAQENNVNNLLNISSSCIYPKNHDLPLKEEDILTGELEQTNEGYALAKIMALKLCNYISLENNQFNYKSIIPCNLYGPHDKFDEDSAHMIPGVINRMHKAKTDKIDIDIWGTGNVRREFMFIEDLVDFVYFSLNNFNRMPNVLNVGLGYDHTINEYYNTIAKVINYKGDFKHDISKPEGMKRKLVDVEKLREFGWKHKYTLEYGIKKTYQYYLNKI